MGEYAFLAVYRNSYGMDFANLRDAGNGMTTAWLILGVEWVVFMGLAWYLEQVCGGGGGMLCNCMVVVLLQTYMRGVCVYHAAVSLVCPAVIHGALHPCLTMKL
jgi:hypothetical protein